MNKRLLSTFGIFLVSSVALAQNVQSEEQTLNLEQGMTYSGPTDPPRYQARFGKKDRPVMQREAQTQTPAKDSPAVPLREYNNGQVFGDQ